jgi:ABC-type uncharacterized transport system ATPase subunit
VHENVRLGIIARRRETVRPFGAVDGLHADDVRELLDAVGLLPVEHHRAGNLSHGNQRAGIGDLAGARAEAAVAGRADRGDGPGRRPSGPCGWSAASPTSAL